MNIQQRPLVFVDIETTGAAAWNSRVLEVGAIRVDNGMVVERYNQLLDPQEMVPPFITNLTGIQPSHTKGMPTFAEVSAELAELFEGAVFIAHNVDFDYGFLRTEFSRLGMRLAVDRMCTVRLSRALYPTERSHRLDEVIRRAGYIIANRHRAYDDAEILHRFFRDNLERLGDDVFYGIANRLVRAAPLIP